LDDISHQTINVMLAAAGFNFKRAISLLFCPFLESLYRLLDTICGWFWSVFETDLSTADPIGLKAGIIELGEGVSCLVRVGFSEQAAI